MSQQPEDTDQGLCEALLRPVASDDTCDALALYRYPDMAYGGYMRMCEEHGQRFARSYGTEYWHYGAWHRQGGRAMSQRPEQAETPVVGGVATRIREIRRDAQALRSEARLVRDGARNHYYGDNSASGITVAGWVEYLSAQIDQLADALAASQAHAAKKGECLAFFASVIKSGEPWTATCQREYDAAMKKGKA